MLSLKERSLLAAASQLTTLKEVLALCESTGSARDVCDKSKAFWLSILPRVDYEVLALSFQPLKEKYWPELIEALRKNLYIRYSFYIEDEVFEQQPEDGILGTFYTALDGPEHIKFGYEEHFFTPALPLSSGTIGWIFEYNFDTKDDLVQKELNFVLASKEDNDFDRLLKVVVALYMRSLKIFSLDSGEYNQTKHYSIVREENNRGVIERKLTYQNGAVLTFYDLSQTEKLETPYRRLPDPEIIEEMFGIAFEQNFELPVYYYAELYLYSSPTIVEDIAVFNNKQKTFASFTKVRLY